MPRWKYGAFGVKDLFTLVNLAAGVAAMRFALVGEPRNAGYAVIAGYLGGDIVDGAVARATNTGNRFGAELDTVTDHFVHVIVPALVLYSVYRSGGHGGMGLVAGGVLIGAATIRHARFAAAPFRYPLAWCGLPRTVPGFFALAYALSHFLARHPSGYPLGTALVVALSAMTLVPVPYMTHRGARAMQWYVRFSVAWFLLGLPVVALLARRYLFDLFAFDMVVYAMAGWVPVRADERAGFYGEYHRWAADLAR
jgi:phosphatidylserine synthase